MYNLRNNSKKCLSLDGTSLPTSFISPCIVDLQPCGGLFHKSPRGIPEQNKRSVKVWSFVIKVVCRCP